MRRMTKQEFKEYLEQNFWDWICVHPDGRPLDSLLLSMEDWASRQYNRVVKEEKES